LSEVIVLVTASTLCVFNMLQLFAVSRAVSWRRRAVCRPAERVLCIRRCTSVTFVVCWEFLNM